MKIAAENRPFLLLFLILMMGLGLRIYHLDSLSLWSDEAFTSLYSASSLSYLWTTGFRLETNPPLYYTVMHFWILFFGSSESALRSFSVIMSLLVIVLVYALGLEIESSALGLIGALIVALAPTEIWYAQEARTFALLQVFIGIALLGMARFLSDSGSWASLIAFVVGATLANYCHDTALLFFIACNVTVLCGTRSINARKRLGWVAANAFVFVLSIPLLLTTTGQIGSSNIQWIPPLTTIYFLRMIRELTGGMAPGGMQDLQYSLLALLGLAFVVFRTLKLDRRAALILLLVPAVFGVLAILFCFYKPILVTRVLLWIWIPMALLLAHILVHSSTGRLPILILMVLMLATGLASQLFPSGFAKDNWRKLVELQQGQLSQADAIVLTQSASLACFIHYMPAAIPRLLFLPQVPTETQPRDFEQSFIFEKFGLRSFGPKELLRAIQNGKRVWILDQKSEAMVPLSLASLPSGYRSDLQSSDIGPFHVFTCGYP